MSRRLLTLAAPLGLLLLAGGCTVPSPPDAAVSWSLQSEKDRVAGRMEIRRVLRDLEIAEATGNLPALASLYDSEAVWVPPEAPLVRGRDAILAAYELLFAEMEVQVVLTDESVSVTDQAGQVLGWAAVTHTPRATLGGELSQEIFRYRMVLDRDESDSRERSWRIRYLHWWPWVNLYDEPEPFPGPPLPDPALDPIAPPGQAPDPPS